MKRIKNLGLAVVTATALSAVLGVAGASASQFLAEKYPASVTTSETSHTLNFHSISAKCSPAPEAELKSFSKTVEATAKDSTCEMFGNPAMKMNGCKFIYHPGLETSSGVFAGTFEIGPANCGSISISQAGAICGPITIPAQTGLAATFENVGTGSTRSVKISAQATGLKHTQGSSGGCTAGTFSDGKWTGSWKLQASNGGKQVGMYVGTNPISISGTPPQLNAGSFPLSLTGEQSGGYHTLGFAAGTAECTTAKLSAEVPSSAWNPFPVSAEYGGCNVFGLAGGSVSMNGCNYAFSITSHAVGQTYNGHADINCPAGKAIEVVSTSGGKVRCTVTIPTQVTDSGGLSYTNQAFSTIYLSLSVKGIDYHQQKGEGLGACATGDYTNGTYSGSSVLEGGYL